MAIKRVCDRCGNITNGHRLYFGRYVAIDRLWSSQTTSTWSRWRKDVCFDCYSEFEKWMENK